MNDNNTKKSFSPSLSSGEGINVPFSFGFAATGNIFKVEQHCTAQELQNVENSSMKWLNYLCLNCHAVLCQASEKIKNEK